MKKELFIPIFFGIMIAFGVASTVISSIAFSSFYAFEILYFIFLVMGFGLLFTEIKIKGHKSASIMIFTLGFFINTFIWTIGMVDTVGLILNIILTALLFGSGVMFIHAKMCQKDLFKFALILVSVVALCIVATAVYNLAISLSSDNTPLINTTYIIQNLSLLSTIIVPVAQILDLKESK